MKKVLIISHAFPPSAGSGVIRTLKFVKYLPENGWFPVILTLKERYNSKKDFSMQREIPEGVKVYRTNIWDPLLIYNSLKVRFFNHGKGNIATKNKLLTINGASEVKSFKLSKFILDFFTTPDNFIGWLVPAVFRGVIAIRKHKVDLIYTTCPAETSNLIGLILKKITHKPWVTDFRDPWTLRNEPYKMGKIRMMLENWLEAKVMKNADKIIANTEYLRNAYLRKYNNLTVEKISVVTNGFDPADFVNIPVKKIESDGVFTVSHIGEFYEEIRNPDNFLSAVAELLKEGKIEKNKIKINFIGGGEYVFTGKFRNLLNKLEIKDVVSVSEHLTHEQSLQYMFNSDLLLLLQPSHRTVTQVPAKLFEYIRTGNCIIALAPRGATAEIIKKISHGVLADPDSVQDIKDKLLNVYSKHEKINQRNEIQLSEVNNFDRRKLTKQLALVFDELTKT
jgi:glycosyltransferase involved in cell wall biosynthesis